MIEHTTEGAAKSLEKLLDEIRADKANPERVVETRPHYEAYLLNPNDAVTKDDESQHEKSAFKLTENMKQLIEKLSNLSKKDIMSTAEHQYDKAFQFCLSTLAYDNPNSDDISDEQVEDEIYDDYGDPYECFNDAFAEGLEFANTINEQINLLCNKGYDIMNAMEAINKALPKDIYLTTSNKDIIFLECDYNKNPLNNGYKVRQYIFG